MKSGVHGMIISPLTDYRQSSLRKRELIHVIRLTVPSQFFAQIRQIFIKIFPLNVPTSVMLRNTR